MHGPRLVSCFATHGQRGEAGAAARAALGRDEHAPRLGSQLPAAWDAVALLRDPDSLVVPPPPPPPTRAADLGAAVRRAAATASPASPPRVMTRFAHSFGGDGMPDLRRWLILAWPGNREPYYPVALRRYRTVSLWMSDADRQSIGVGIEPLLHPDEPFTASAIALLAEALGSTEQNRLLATEVTIEAIATRRLPPDELGRAIGGAMVGERAVCDRWADSLGPVAQVSALHAHETQRMIEVALATLGDERPRMTRLLDLLRRIAQDGDARIEDPAARAWLEGVTGQSKTAKLAGAALAVDGGGAARSAEAAAAAAEGERSQALRWSS